MAQISNTSHLTGKFATEGENIIPSLYFSHFKEKLEHFKTAFVTSPPRRTGKIGVDLLDYDGEPARFDFDPILSAKDTSSRVRSSNQRMILNEDLETVKFRAKETRKDMSRLSPKYSLYHFTHGTLSALGKFGPPVLDQVHFVFKVYRPYLAEGRREDIKIQQEIVMREYHTLKQLEKVIECSLDYLGLEDVSENPPPFNAVSVLSKAVKKKYPASFFFINNTFYVNEPDGSDVSGVAIKFMEKNVEKPCVKVECHDKCQPLANLALQVGRPYLYQHVGHCEHVVMVSDIRLRGADDSTRSGVDICPIVSAVSNVSVKQCLLCALAPARWLVTNFLKLTMARAFLCNRCFVSFCYIDGRKAGDFQAYQYLDPIHIL